MGTHNLCFLAKSKKKYIYKKVSFLQPKTSLLIAWACFRNGTDSETSHGKPNEQLFAYLGYPLWPELTLFSIQ